MVIRCKPLEQQPIDWHPDLHDGVRLDIRPFMEGLWLLSFLSLFVANLDL